MQNLLLLCGGKSAEHEISIRSCKNVFEATDKTKFAPHVVIITRNNILKYVKLNSQINNVISDNDLNEIDVLDVYLIQTDEGAFLKSEDKSVNIQLHIVFPVLHGPYGEDGKPQGMFEMLDIPYVGCGVTASSIAMDKEYTKALLKSYGIPIGDYFVVRSKKEAPTYEESVSKLNSPVLFVKPANLGSAVGVYKVTNENEYDDAITNAFQFDHKIIIEKAIKAKEIECAVLGNYWGELKSSCGELKPNQDFYSYDAKYIDENGADVIIPAPIDNIYMEQILNYAKKIFRVLGCTGLSRIDFFLCENGDIFLIEVNTIPGFTSISMYPMLCAHIGISYRELITTLIELGIESYNRNKTLKIKPEHEY
jgi:D-alanine-D-alanine ligase